MSRRDDYAEDSPMYSRLFIVCEKHTQEQTLKDAFSKFGTIEDIKMPRDRTTGDSRGVAYIKFSKTSEAAAALEALNQNVLPGNRRPTKVMVAANRSEVQSSNREEEPLKYKRLFINIPRAATESEIENEFQQYGHISSILIQRDRNTGESKGFAYVTFNKFSEAANALEQCDKKYRPLFATPKNHRRQETTFESNIDYLSKTYNSTSNAVALLDYQYGNGIFTSVMFRCWPHLTQGHIEQLFDIVPGLVSCKYYVDWAQTVGKGTVTYSNPKSAAYAVEKLNEFEYPPGMCIYVKPDNSKFNSFEESSISKVPSTVSKLKNAIELTAASSSPDLAELAKAIAEASNLIKKATGGGIHDDKVDSNDLNYCSVKLPPPKPLANIDSPLAKRCFLVCKPSPPPLTVLRDIFCRFGDLINVYTLPNKTVGYARYASVEAANEAMKVLHGAEICGVRIKVLEAEEEAPPRKRKYEGYND